HAVRRSSGVTSATGPVFIEYTPAAARHVRYGSLALPSKALAKRKRPVDALGLLFLLRAERIVIRSATQLSDRLSPRVARGANKRISLAFRRVWSSTKRSVDL